MIIELWHFEKQNLGRVGKHSLIMYSTYFTQPKTHIPTRKRLLTKQDDNIETERKRRAVHAQLMSEVLGIVTYYVGNNALDTVQGASNAQGSKPSI